VSLTPLANGKKSSIRKVLIILSGHLWEVELTYRYIFAFKFPLRSQQPVLFPLFASGVIDTGSKLPLGANLPPVSTTVAQLVAKFAAGVIDTSGAP
jgi:hypothetical protein